MKSSPSTWVGPLLLFLFAFFSATPLASSSALAKASYSDHCGTIIPESPPTDYAQITYPSLDSQTTSYTGGERILAPKNSSSKPAFQFRTIESAYRTSTAGVYAIQAFLTFRSPSFFVLRNTSRAQARRNRRHTGSLRFVLTGFWSEPTAKLCMVGTASWFSASLGKYVNLEAVLKLNYANDSTMLSSLVSGTLESFSGSPIDSTYFEPVSILSFPAMSQYKYTDLPDAYSGGIDFPPSSSLGIQKRDVCSRLSWPRYTTFMLYHPLNCSSCTAFGGNFGYLPTRMSLHALECSDEEMKLRYLIEFPNDTRFDWYYQSFDPNTTLIGEGSWDNRWNRLCIVACRILKNSTDARVGDCSIRLSLRYPSVWSIKQSVSVEGQIWTNKSVNDPGYFDRITFQSSENNMMRVLGLKYEYTLLDRVRSCAMRKPIKNKVQTYPSAYSYEMRFDMSVTDSKSRSDWGYAVPNSVGDHFYEPYAAATPASTDDYGELHRAPVVDLRSRHDNPLNISYKISLYINRDSIDSAGGISSVNSSSSPNDVYDISAEGVYDGETGHLCMVGCRNLASFATNLRSDPWDCEILVNFYFPPVNEGNGSSGFIMGSIESTRKRDDPLYFGHWNISSNTFYTATAKQSAWRMDLEIIMVLVSKTLACLFIRSQLLHVKRHPDVLPFVSLVMLTFLTLSHMIPLLLNFEALFIDNHSRQSVLLGSGGWLEVNEVIVRVVTMVTFLLQFRVLQLVWTALLGSGNENGFWISQKKSLYASLPMYILGALIALFLNWKRENTYYGEQLEASNSVTELSSLWAGLRSYSGLVLDGFLLPQILLNLFQNSRKSALSHSFYIGITFIRLLPHGYDLYRAHSFVHSHFNGSYIYANPRADFYSAAWDVIIPLLGMIFAVIIYVQQRSGGRTMLPQQFRETEIYERVPITGS
ncbi:hypothetical protein RJ640_024666 [Escallonia rubra]|uniref:RING-type E3 ubiquitin transferase n=1 Tax=Escallonia rubra TaxID=112253 RepID=A0AA88UHT9_9ASTE|nr:hypothetical protein RJ640_024666 [Escallonia rubra]